MSESLEREPHGRHGATEPPKQTEPPKRPELNIRNFHADIAGLKQTVWSLRLEEGETIELPLDRNAWKHVVAQRKPLPGDIVQVRTHDNSQYWSLFVQGVGTGWLKTTLVEATKAEAILELPADCLLATKWNVGSRSYDVIRKDDRTVIQKDIKLKEDAHAWILDHLAKMKN